MNSLDRSVDCVVFCLLNLSKHPNKHIRIPAQRKLLEEYFDHLSPSEIAKLSQADDSETEENSAIFQKE